MDDLYADLENYNEVSSVEELRNENKDLKLKLEEYATAMGKLQKDYDKLSMEFQNLQVNYSSLLKTARAEVERKSKMITQLNLDKDMMVLQALQNGNNRLIHNRNKFQKSVHIPKKIGNVEKGQSDPNKKTKNYPMQKSADPKNERCETSSVSTNVSVPSSENSKLLNIVDKVVEKVDACIYKGELKENIPDSKPDRNIAPKIHASSIKNRRKSMPAVSYPKFSSDEECDSEKPTKRITQKTEQSDTRNINTMLSRISNEILSNKTSDTSSIDDRSSIQQEQPREYIRSRPNRHHDNDKHKIGDRFREAERYRGPDRFRETVRHRESDKYRDGDRYRECDRHRDSDRYRDGDRHRESDRFKETDKYKESDRHRENDGHRESDKFRDGDRHRESDRYREADKYRESDKHRDTQRYRGKNKYDPSQRYRRHSPERPFKRSYREYQDDNRRTEHGRQRGIESPPPEGPSYYNRDQEHVSRSRYERNSYETDKYRPHCEERFVGKYPTSCDLDEPGSKRQKIESETHADTNIRLLEDPVSRLSRNEIHEHEMLRTSCQSPDAAFSPDIHMDASPTHIIKEIKSTAVTPLEDPRVTSKKYVLKTEGGKSSLSTVVDILNIKPIDKSLWQIESVAVPDALLHKPEQQFNEDHIKEIYMDIDNAAIDTSLEPGEIDGDSKNDEKFYATKNTPQNHELNKGTTATSTTPKQEPENTLKVTYKIPKVNQRNQNARSEISNVKNYSHKIKEIYMDIDTAAIDTSLEPGEIVCDSDAVSKIYEKCKESKNTSQNNQLTKRATETTTTQEQRSDNALIDTYKIPKTSQRNQTDRSELSVVKNDSHKIKEIYRNVDNVEIDSSLEPGEIVCDFDAVSKNDVKGKKSKNTSQNNELTKRDTEASTIQKQGSENALKVTYKIPKVNQRNQIDRSEPSNVKNNLHTIISDSAEVKVVKDRHSVKLQSLPPIDNHDNVTETNIVNKTTYEKKKDEEFRITLSDIAMVHDDLELSDETSDNMELHKHVIEEKEKLQKIKTTLKATTNESEKQNKHSFKNVSNVNTDNNKNDLPDGKLKDSDGQKKHKSKRRKTRSKEIELSESADVVSTAEKKTKSKKEKDKPKQIMNKFTDLFGESSSLITPEDLGIPATCVPLCEDAQDAVDININAIVNASLSNTNTAEILNKRNNNDVREETSYSTNAITQDLQIAKRIEEQIARPELDPIIVYQNLNSGAEINKPDVVQTIVISSGVQPQFVLDNREGTTETRIADVEVNIQNIPECNQLPAAVGFRKQNYLQALATSTPHKDFHTLHSLEIDSKAVECPSSHNDSKSGNIDAAGHSMDQSDTNTQESHDAPDVRIFVRRRRKGGKKP